MNALYTSLIWVTAFGSASICILVWVAPTLFKSLLSRPSRWPLRRRQALYSVCSLAGSAFCVYYALTQNPDIERSLWDVVVMGSTTCTFAAAAITGWIYLAARGVGRDSKRTFVARPASEDLPLSIDQPRRAVPQVSAAPGLTSYLPSDMSRRRAASRWFLQALERLYRGVEDAEHFARTPSRLGAGLGIAIVVVVVVVVIVGQIRSLGPWYSATSPTRNELYSVAMVSPTEGWAVGENGTILHYHDRSWSTVSSPTNADLYSVAMVSPTDGWAVGDQTILHYSGGSWSTVSNSASGGLSIAMDSPTDGWAVGGDGTVLHYHDGSWTNGRIPTDSPLNSVVMVSPAEGWAVGVGGTILHYSGGFWSTVSSPTSLDLFSIAMASPTDGWAVGERGVILRYHGGSWSNVGSLTSYILRSVAMVSPTDGWAVGEVGTVLHYSDGSWSKVSSPLTLLFSVAMDSPTDGWAVGGEGAILHYSAGQ